MSINLNEIAHEIRRLESKVSRESLTTVEKSEQKRTRACCETDMYARARVYGERERVRESKRVYTPSHRLVRESISFYSVRTHICLQQSVLSELSVVSRLTSYVQAYRRNQQIMRTNKSSSSKITNICNTSLRTMNI